MDEKTKPMRRYGVIAFIVVVLGALILLEQLRGPALHEVEGSVTSVDLERREASIEVIDPTDGKTREFRGTVSPDCSITVNGNPATLDDLQVGDLAHVWARSLPKATDPEGELKARFVAERVQIRRP